MSISVASSLISRKMVKMHILTSSNVSEILLHLSDAQLDSLHNSLAQVLSAYTQQNEQSAKSDRRIIQPLRTVMTTNREITTLTMPVSNTEVTAVKTVTVPPGGPIKGSITVYNAMGDLLGLLNAAEVTAFRTALTSMLALSRSKWGRQHTTGTPSSEKHNLIVFGGGKQAEWHTRLAMRFSTIKTVTVVNRSLQRLKDLEAEMFSELRTLHPDTSFKCLAQERNESYDEQLRTALSLSDIICCTTPSTTPLFSAKLLGNPSKSRFISLIGSYKPNMQEIDSDTLLSGHESKIIVDSREACLEEAGELIKANVTADQLVEVGQLYSGTTAGHDVKEDQLLAPSSANVIFKCVGLSLMDLAVSKELLEMSQAIGVGTTLDDF